MPKKLSPELLITDLQKVAESLGYTPFTFEYNELGSYTYNTFLKYFGSWKKACLAAGLEPTRGRGGHNRIPDKVYLSRIRSLYSKLGRLPLARDYRDEYGHAIIVFRRWHSWEKALELAGIDSANYQQEYILAGLEARNLPAYFADSDDNFLDDLRAVAESLGHTPTCEEYRENGKYSFQAFFDKFGSWKTACEMVGLTPHTTHEGRPHRVPSYDYKRLYDDKTIKLIGSYELRFAKYLDDQGYHWLCHGEFQPLVYRREGKRHRYMPDFYVPSLGVYYETKGWFHERDKLKIKLVRRQLKVDIVVVTREVLELFGC